MVQAQCTGECHVSAVASNWNHSVVQDTSKLILKVYKDQSSL